MNLKSSIKNTLIPCLLENGKKLSVKEKSTLQELATNVSFTMIKYTYLAVWTMTTAEMISIFSIFLPIPGNSYPVKVCLRRLDRVPEVSHLRTIFISSEVTQSKMENTTMIFMVMTLQRVHGHLLRVLALGLARGLTTLSYSMEIVSISLAVKTVQTDLVTYTNALSIKISNGS